MTSALAERPLPRASTGEPVLDDEDGVAAFSGVRPRLFGIAYRILGSWSEAEDLVQDVWLRWHGCDRTVIRNPTAFLVTTTTRLALNVVQTARVRRESPSDRWWSEPVGEVEDPAHHVEQGEALDGGILLLCERLAPAERAAFVLRTAFDYPYDRIASMLHVSEANARQLVSRAGRRVMRGRVRPVDPDLRRNLTAAFVAAARHGSVATLERLLVADVTSAAIGVAARPAVPARLAV